MNVRDCNIAEKWLVERSWKDIEMLIPDLESWMLSSFYSIISLTLLQSRL